MRIPNSAHEAHPWIIQRIAPDFPLHDAWALPVEGTLADAGAALSLLADFDPLRAGNPISRALFMIRLRVGDLLGIDGDVPRPIPGCAETSLAERLPTDLRTTGTQLPVSVALAKAAGGFRPLYRTADEWAAELSNATVHGVLHIGWVPIDGGRYRAQMGVYVKPRGRLGAAYMRFIDPFRLLLVYPSLMRHLERVWSSRRPTPVSATANTR